MTCKVFVLFSPSSFSPFLLPLADSFLHAVSVSLRWSTDNQPQPRPLATQNAHSEFVVGSEFRSSLPLALEPNSLASFLFLFLVLSPQSLGRSTSSSKFLYTLTSALLNFHDSNADLRSSFVIVVRPQRRVVDDLRLGREGCSLETALSRGREGMVGGVTILNE